MAKAAAVGEITC